MDSFANWPLYCSTLLSFNLFRCVFVCVIEKRPIRLIIGHKPYAEHGGSLSGVPMLHSMLAIMLGTNLNLLAISDQLVNRLAIGFSPNLVN